MKRKLLLVLMSALVVITSCSKNDSVDTGGGDQTGAEVLQGDITSSRTLTADKIYLLKGNVFVTNNAVLTIQPGTIIKGDKATKGALVISRGSKIEAAGTVDKPIVFTSSAAAGARKEGDWGGLILLGKAKNNVGNAVAIEGIPATEKGQHGGTDDADNSGTLKYVRVEYAGIALSPDNEINGITFGSVGSGTVVDYVEVYRSGDDAYEWFGGTVNAKHLLAIDTWDDDFDTDNGFSGHIQFALAQRLAATADVSGSNGFESDNNSTGTNATPQTSAVFSNVTILGPSEGPAEDGTRAPSINANFQHAAQIRRNSALNILNSVFVGYTEGVFFDDALPGASDANNSSQALLTNKSVFAYNVVAGCNSKSNQIKATNATILGNVTTKLTDLNNVFDPAVLARAIYTAPYKFSGDIAAGARTGTPDFRQVAGNTLALTGANFDNAKVNVSFFDKVAYKGAFGTENWAAGWAHFDPQSLEYTTPGKVTSN